MKQQIKYTDPRTAAKAAIANWLLLCDKLDIDFATAKDVLLSNAEAVAITAQEYYQHIN